MFSWCDDINDGNNVMNRNGEQGCVRLHGTACEGGRGDSLIYMDPMMSREGRRMVKAFSTLSAPVWFFHRQDALFWEGVVGESLP